MADAMATDEKKDEQPAASRIDRSEADGADGSFFIDSPLPIAKKLPPWLDHFNARDLKILFKCSLAVWIMTIFIFIDETLRVLGQATFFGCIVLFIVPPSGVVFIHTLAGACIALGLALGWAWGVITMKAALATRPQADLAAQYRLLQQSGTQNTTNIGPASGQTSYAQIAIFEGFMLDTRVTVTYFCMMGLFVYLLARLRVAAPKLTLIGLFAMVVADIYLTMAPLIPTFQGTIPQVMIIPVGVAVGVGIVCNVLIFPQSTSTIVLDNMKNVLTPMQGYVKSLSWHFRNPDSRFDLQRLRRLKTELAAVYQNLDGARKFLPMDFSYSRWSQEDISSLEEPLRQVFVAFTELLQLSIAREESKEKNDALTTAAEKLYQEKDPGARLPVAHHQIARAVDLRVHAQHPDTVDMVAQSLTILAESSAPLLRTWGEAVDAVAQALSGTTVKDASTVLEKHRQTLESLRDVQRGFESSAGQLLLGPHSHLFDSQGNVIYPNGSNRTPPLLGLVIGLLFQERIVNLSRSATSLLERVLEMEERRPKARIWLPTGLRRIFSWGLSKDETPSATQGTLDLQRSITSTSRRETKKRRFKETPEETKTPDVTSAAARLEAMRAPTGRVRKKASTVTLSIIHFFTSDEGLFALRTLIVTLALSVPAVVRTSAGFYYREKGLWALIMAQMALVPYTSDFVAGLIIRTLGTVVGGIIGLLCWYIGAGSGPGNPYGLAAVMAVAIVVTMWWRLFAPPEQITAGIMLTSTAYMVVSYSWIDTHIPSYGNPGVGYELFWRRILLVLIGFGASMVVTFFPRPPSGNRHYRHLLADELTNIKDRYALLVSTYWSPPDDLVSVIEKEAIVSGELLTSLVEPIKLTKFEFSASNIDTETLSHACHLITTLNQSITQLVLYTAKLPLHLRTQFMHTTGAGTESLLADIMAVLTLVQQSLRSGAPLPAILPTPLVARSLVWAKEHAQGVNQMEGGIKTLVRGEAGRQWVSAFNGLIRLLGAADDLVLVVKSAVGEGSNVDLGGFDLERAVG